MTGKSTQGTPDVFISHSSADRRVAKRVCTAIEAAGLQCWIAPRDILPGRSWAESIIHAIHQCGLILLVFSSRADRSRQIAREVERADKRDLPIVTLRLEDMEPTGALAYFTSAVQMVDAFKGSLKRTLEQLISELRHLLAPRHGGRKADRDREEDHYSGGYESIQSGRYLEAARLLTKYLRKHPDDAAGYNLRGHAYNEAGKLRSAIVDFSSAIRLRPEFGEAYFHRATAYIRANQPDAGIGDLKESLRRDLDTFFVPYAYYNLGATYYQTGEYRRALVALDHAVKLNPKLGDAYYYRAQARKKLNDIRGFSSDMRKASRFGSAGAEP